MKKEASSKSSAVGQTFVTALEEVDEVRRNSRIDPEKLQNV
jgi:hypothetical protein